MTSENDRPDPLQGHTREWPSTPYSDEARAQEPSPANSCCIALIGDCTMSDRSWPGPENQMAVRLRRAFPEQPFVIRNISEDVAEVVEAVDRVTGS